MTIRDVIGDPANGNDFIDALDDRFAVIWNGVMLHMTSVGGTADAVTATVTPAVGVDGYLNGMAFSIVWGAANTITNFTLNGLPVVGPAGEALPVGAVVSGLASVLVVVDDEFRVMTPIAADAESVAYYWQITSSQTVTWPTNLPDDRRVRVQAWGAGGGGHNTVGAGGGGGYAETEFRLTTLGASTTCTIGTGGVAGALATAGGNTTFGSLLTAYGGAGGSASNGGGGGGTNAAASGGTGGYLGGGDGGTFDGAEIAPESASSLWGGGGGAYGTIIAGGIAVFGGGGGSAGTGGTSKFGGAGGASGVAGSAPAGGGGRNAAGGRGEIRIWIG